MPCVTQGTDYSCGAASLQAVLSYWGTDLPESELMGRLHTSPHHGTHEEDIVRVAKELGFAATMETGLTVRDLALSVQEGIPVIIVAQAWAEEQSGDFSWADDWDHGHYMVVIGVDNDHVCLEDPALEECREMLPIDDFEERWHSILGVSPSAPDTVFVQHLGIFITRS
ncbi:MAG: cysteine peptidase family C39 domain-containing protein [Methanomassiliicoccus sp.]|nr:cysteine peptidase family C39 domain-containing protein [Methanomassiliicoccus sp.]